MDHSGILDGWMGYLMDNPSIHPALKLTWLAEGALVRGGAGSLPGINLVHPKGDPIGQSDQLVIDGATDTLW